MTKYSTHFGVYGVALKNEKLLCIRKNAGPYKNRFDLPGGSQENGESLTETLFREVLEETGCKISSYQNNRIYDSFVKETGRPDTVHHIFVLYSIEFSDAKKKEIPAIVADGKNDSDGAIWVKISELNEENSSPIILKVLEEIIQSSKLLEASNYLHWKVKC